MTSLSPRWGSRFLGPFLSRGSHPWLLTAAPLGLKKGRRVILRVGPPCVSKNTVLSLLAPHESAEYREQVRVIVRPDVPPRGGRDRPVCRVAPAADVLGVAGRRLQVL